MEKSAANRNQVPICFNQSSVYNLRICLNGGENQTKKRRSRGQGGARAFYSSLPSKLTGGACLVEFYLGKHT